MRGDPAPTPCVPCSCGCGAPIPSRDRYNRPRRFVNARHAGRRASCADRVLEALAGGQARPFAEIVREAGVTRKAVATALGRLRTRGQVIHVRRGVWQLPAEWCRRGPAPPPCHAPLRIAPNRRFSPVEIASIRGAVSQGPRGTAAYLARLYGVRKSTITKIVRGDHYREWCRREYDLGELEREAS